MTKRQVINRIRKICAGMPNGPFLLRDLPGLKDYPSLWGVFMYDAVASRQIPDVSYIGKECRVNSYMKDSAGNQGNQTYIIQEEEDMLQDLYGSDEYMAEANDWVLD